MKRVFLSLGSNLGDRPGNITQALHELTSEGIGIQRVSSFYRTEPVDYKQQPWFINCVAEAATELLPLQLLKAVQRVERSLGRRHVINKGPRKIDIDILLYDNVVVHSAALNIPHVSMAERRFVLVPLGELEAGLRHPVTERTVTEMLSETADTSQVIRIDSADAAGGR
ncbi:MAG: 2-amino-4-hydroxy-6-hydroxymethyldihydropteridine diphosphokinase [Limisphaerales bacterium]